MEVTPGQKISKRPLRDLVKTFWRFFDLGQRQLAQHAAAKTDDKTTQRRQGRHRAVFPNVGRALLRIASRGGTWRGCAARVMWPTTTSGMELVGQGHQGTRGGICFHQTAARRAFGREARPLNRGGAGPGKIGGYLSRGFFTRLLLGSCRRGHQVLWEASRPITTWRAAGRGHYAVPVTQNPIHWRRRGS